MAPHTGYRKRRFAHYAGKTQPTALFSQQRQSLSIGDHDSAGLLFGDRKHHSLSDRNSGIDRNDGFFARRDIEHAPVDRMFLRRVGIKDPKLILTLKRIVRLKSCKYHEASLQCIAPNDFTRRGRIRSGCRPVDPSQFLRFAIGKI